MTYEPTPYAVVCVTNILGEKGCGQVFMTETEYLAQMSRPNATWRCPSCGNDECYFDDDNYEASLDDESKETT